MDYCLVSGEAIVALLSSSNSLSTSSSSSPSPSSSPYTSSPSPSSSSSLSYNNIIRIINSDGKKLQTINVNDLTYKADNDDEYLPNVIDDKAYSDVNIIGLTFSQLSYHLVTITAYSNKSNQTTYRIHIFACNKSFSSSSSVLVPKWTLIKTINPDTLGIDFIDLGFGLNTSNNYQKLIIYHFITNIIIIYSNREKY